MRDQVNGDTRAFRKALAGSSSPLLTRIIERDGDYLFDAYEKIERYWRDEFNAFHNVFLVLLSEAPRFGEQQTYFYNQNAGATAFFNYKDYTEAFGSYGTTLPAAGGIAVRKRALLDALQARGVLILDIFPFALNDCTSVSYGKLIPAERTELFRATAPHYFRPKMSLALKKATPRTLFAFRYTRVHDACKDLVRSEMTRFGIESSRVLSESVSGFRGGISHDRLHKVYKMATDNAY